MPNRIQNALQDFFSHNDLPEIIEAINTANVSHIQHKENRSRRNIADTVHLTTRAADFLIRLNDVWLRMKVQA